MYTTPTKIRTIPGILQIGIPENRDCQPPSVAARLGRGVAGLLKLIRPFDRTVLRTSIQFDDPCSTIRSSLP